MTSSAPRGYSLPQAWGNQPRSNPDWVGLPEVMTLMQFDGPVGLADDERLFRRCRVKAGQTVFDSGQSFDGLYVVRLGALKSVVTHDDGAEHVLSFAMKGDLLGTEGVCANRYRTEAVALTDSEVIRLPASELFSPGRASNDIERMAYWAISRELVKEQMSYTLTHAVRSDVRVARFLLLQSDCFAAIGCSPRRLTLPMTRRDIGNYLNITLETVSRALSALHQLGVIDVSHREVVINSHEALRAYEG